MNYLRAFSQSEMDKYFAWIITKIIERLQPIASVILLANLDFIKMAEKF